MLVYQRVLEPLSLPAMGTHHGSPMSSRWPSLPAQAYLDRLGSAAAQMLRLLRLSQEAP